MRLSSNQLSGSIPNFNLPKLHNLKLSSNQLSGTVPDFNLPELKYLYLFENQLSGEIPNFNLPELHNLRLSSNQLSGTIPDFNDLDKLYALDIRNNNFTFQGIPNSINVSTFKYSPQNNIPITSEGYTLYVDAGGKLENNTYTWYKDSAKYKTIVGDSLLIATESGSYYCKVTNKTVKKLTLQSDTIYINICSLKLKHDSLELVNLYNATNGDQWENKWDLTKPVYTWYGVSLTDDGCSVKSIDLPSNRLSGQIPNLDLPNLESLDLSNNQLSDSIPKFDSLPNLKVLRLLGNLLRGSIPDFNYLNKLDTLDIRMNNFTFQGIPNSINVSTFEYYPQPIIGVYQDNVNNLYVEAGIGDIEKNTYYWYKDYTKYKTIINDSTLTVQESGTYYCKVVKTVSLKDDNEKDIVLNSNIFGISTATIITQENQLTKRTTKEWGDDMLIFPNPAKESVSIEVKGSKGKQVDIKVFDRLGVLRLERSVKPSTARISLDVSSLSHGYYYVRVQVEGKYMGVKTLIISH